MFCATLTLPSVVQQIALIKLMVQTDPSVLPASLVLSSVSHITTLVFFAVLVVMIVARQLPQRTALGFYPRCVAVAGVILSVRVTVLKAVASRSKPDRGAVTSFVEVINQAGDVVMTFKVVNIIAKRSPGS